MFFSGCENIDTQWIMHNLWKPADTLCDQTSHWFVLSVILICLRHQFALNESQVLVAWKKTSEQLFCVLSRSYRAWTTFTLSAKSSTLTSSLRTSCCVWRSSPTKNQQGAAAPPLDWMGNRPSPQAHIINIQGSSYLYKADVLGSNFKSGRILTHKVSTLYTRSYIKEMHPIQNDRDGQNI